MRKKLKLVLLLIVLGVVSSVIIVNVNNTRNNKETKEVEVIEAEDIDIKEEEKNIEEEKESVEPASNSDEEKAEVKKEESKEEKVENVAKEESKEEPKEEVKESSNLVSLGEFKLTAYCPCSKCCGKSDGITASGTKATEGRTVACNSLPIGTKIRINGHDYIVEDRGTSHIDIFFSSHSEALNFGVRYAEVFKVN